MKNVSLELKRTVVENTGNALKKLGRLVDESNKQIFNTYTILCGEYNRIESDIIDGVISRENANVERASIQRRLLEFIDSLNEQDLISSRLMQDIIFERILVVVKGEERVKFMEQLFPIGYFPNLEYERNGHACTAEGFDIVLFDDKSTQVEGKTNDELLLHFLEKEDSIVLFFGGYSEVIKQFPEHASATNSVFSIHARIMEVIEYLKYRKAYDTKGIK